MPFAVTDEQRELVSTARKLLADAARADPPPPAWDTRDAGINRKLWRSLAELGLLGLGVAEERGGSGAGVRELCLLAEQVGAAVLRVPFTGTAAVLAILGQGAGGQDVSAIVDGSVVAVPAWETFPFIPAHSPGRCTPRMCSSSAPVPGGRCSVPPLSSSTRWPATSSRLSAARSYIKTRYAVPYETYFVRQVAVLDRSDDRPAGRLVDATGVAGGLLWHPQVRRVPA